MAETETTEQVQGWVIPLTKEGALNNSYQYHNIYDSGDFSSEGLDEGLTAIMECQARGDCPPTMDEYVRDVLASKRTVVTRDPSTFVIPKSYEPFIYHKFTIKIPEPWENEDGSPKEESVPEDYGKDLVTVTDEEQYAFTFYVNSVSWDDSELRKSDSETTLDKQVACLNARDTGGDGTAGNPWKNLTYALDQISCIEAGAICEECANKFIRIVITGTIDYIITAYELHWYTDGEPHHITTGLTKNNLILDFVVGEHTCTTGIWDLDDVAVYNLNVVHNDKSPSVCCRNCDGCIFYKCKLRGTYDPSKHTEHEDQPEANYEGGVCFSDGFELGTEKFNTLVLCALDNWSIALDQSTITYMSTSYDCKIFSAYGDTESHHYELTCESASIDFIGSIGYSPNYWYNCTFTAKNKGCPEFLYGRYVEDDYQKGQVVLYRCTINGADVCPKYYNHYNSLYCMLIYNSIVNVYCTYIACATGAFYTSFTSFVSHSSARSITYGLYVGCAIVTSYGVSPDCIFDNCDITVYDDYGVSADISSMMGGTKMTIKRNLIAGSRDAAGPFFNAVFENGRGGVGDASIVDSTIVFEGTLQAELPGTAKVADTLTIFDISDLSIVKNTTISFDINVNITWVPYDGPFGPELREGEYCIRVRSSARGTWDPSNTISPNFIETNMSSGCDW